MAPPDRAKPFVKQVQRSELTAQRWVCARLPEVVPRLLGARPQAVAAGESPVWEMALEDLRASEPGGELGEAVTAQVGLDGGGTADRVGLLGDGLVQLARVHNEFQGHDAALRRSGLPSFPDLAKAPLSLTQLRAEAEALGLDLPARAFDCLVALETELASLHELLAADDAMTLVHGDFHLSNLYRTGAGRVLILDWGAACVGPAAWDLVACPQQLVDRYLSSRAVVAGGAASRTFLQRLRAATALRMRTVCRTYLGAMRNWPDEARYRMGFRTAITLLVEAGGGAAGASGALHQIGSSTAQLA